MQQLLNKYQEKREIYSYFFKTKKTEDKQKHRVVDSVIMVGGERAIAPFFLRSQSHV